VESPATVEKNVAFTFRYLIAVVVVGLILSLLVAVVWAGRGAFAGILHRSSANASQS
jgi:hypothetical protein